MDVIQIQGIEKTFLLNRKKKQKALHPLTLNVRSGEIFGFLGPNGAGKSTTLKLLLNFIRPDSGEIVILGKKVGRDEFRHDIGYLAEFPCFYPHITAQETLTFVGRICGLNRSKINQKSQELLQRVNLEESAHQKIAKFSKGMKQRLGLAVAMIHSPKILIFDEPMSGLDPIGRHLIKGIITELNAQGTTVFFSSHILADIEELCDNIGILHKGRLLYNGTIGDFRKSGSLEESFVSKIEEWNHANMA